MYQLSRSIIVNEIGQRALSRQQVWNGLVMKAHNALPYVAMMQKCVVVEKHEGWLLRDIVLAGVPLTEKVTFFPQERVVFVRTAGSELGQIENVIGENADGQLTLTFTFALTKNGIVEGSVEETAHFAPMEEAYLNAVASTLSAVRRDLDAAG